MALDFGIVYPLWVHQDEPGSLLDQVIGEVGVEHITLPVVTGERRSFRYFLDPTSAYFHTEGGWHYPPDAKRYIASGAKPKTARWCGQRDVLKRVADAAAQRGVRLHMVIDPLAAPSARAMWETTAERNAWGVIDADAWPCISSPALRELVHETISDLSRLAPTEVVVDGLLLDRGHPRLPELSAWWRLLDLMRICFCPACRQIAHAAGIDADAAARSVTVHGKKAMDAARAGDEADIQAMLETDEVVAGYRECRWESARRWMTHLAGEHGATRFARPVDDFASHTEETFSGLHTEKWQRRMDVSWSGWEADELDEFTAQAGAFGITSVTLDLWSQVTDGPEALLRVISGMAAAGIESFDFTHAEELPPDALDGLRKALRYARRA